MVIPTLNRPESLAGVLLDLQRLAPADVEVVVVDQSPPEAGVAELFGGLDGRFRHLPIAERGLPNARNVGIRATRAPVVLFLDDDVRLLPGAVEAHRRAYDDPRVGGVVGRIVERSARPNARRTVNRVAPGGRVVTNLWGTERVEVEVLKGANMSFRRAALDQVGGFDRNYRGTALLEDADVSERVRRAGWTLWFEPEAEVVHLSDPGGGVRQDGVHLTERWRFHNTGYFVRRHRGIAAAPRLWATFGAIALRRAVQWKDRGAARVLMAALGEGWALGGQPPDVEIR